jgi:hypothetical protein
MMAMIIVTRKIKRHTHTHAPKGKISYGPMIERDIMRIEYLNDKI